MSEEVSTESLDNVNSEVNGAEDKIEESKPVERTFTQSEVDKLAVAMRKKGYEQAVREKSTQQAQSPAPAVEQPAYQQQAAAEVNQQQQLSDQQRSQMTGLSVEEIRRIALEATQGQQEQAAKMAVAQKIISEVGNKFTDAAKKLDDFENTVSSLKFDVNPQLLTALNSVDNAGEVAYEIASNPQKRAQMKLLINNDFDDAVAIIKSISDSIKNNESAVNSATPVKQPLGQVKPTSSGVDSGPLTMAELKKQSWAKN